MALSPYTLVIGTKSDSLTGFNIIPNAPYEIRFRNPNGSSGALANIFEDEAGIIPITQTGATVDSRGSATFYADAIPLNAEYNNGTAIIQPIDMGISNQNLGTAIIGDSSTTSKFDTEQEYKDHASVLPTNKRIYLADRNAYFNVIAGTGTANTFNIVASTSVNQSIELDEKAPIDIRKWGAVSGGDISAVLQSMVDEGELSARIPTLLAGFTMSAKVTISTLGFELLGQTGIGYYRSLIASTGASFDMFDITQGEFSCSGIRFLGDGASYGAGATVNVFNMDGTGAADVDSHIFNNSFTFLNTAIKLNGRNLDVKNNLFSNIQFGIDVLGTVPPSDFRGLTVQENRFHSLGLVTVPGSVCVRCPGSANFQELILNNNYCDDSAVFFEGYASNLSIKVNDILRGVGGIKVDSTGHGITADRRNIAINDNTIDMQTSLVNDRHGIEITNASSRGTCNINTISNTGKAGIKGTSARLLTITGNTINNPSIDNPNINSCIEIDAGSTENIVSDNILIKGANTRRGLDIAGSETVLGPQVFSGFSVGTKTEITDDTTMYNQPVGTRNSGWGDTNTTLTPAADDEVQRHSTVLTSDREVALSTLNAFDGAKFRIVRVSGGAFNMNIRNDTVGGTLIKPLASNEWVEATYVETTSQWLLTGFGAL